MRKKTLPYLWAAFLAHTPRISKYFSDKAYLRMIYRGYMGKKLDLKNPKTFNEKLQWLKLYNRNPVYTRMVDKYEAKSFIAEKVGEEYIIPTLGVWDKFDEIDFDRLPAQFVLKCTHDSGGLIICKDKSKLNLKEAKKKITKSLKRNFYHIGREWPYKNVKPRIIAEQYMVDNSGIKEECLTDYKFFCFDGQPKMVYISQDKAQEPHTDFFDMDFNRLNLRMRDSNSETPPSKPVAFEQMRELATVLSQDIAHIRVDFYYVNNKIYIGELTFFHNSGFTKIHPLEWAQRLGDWIKLPEKSTK